MANPKILVSEAHEMSSNINPRYNDTGKDSNDFNATSINSNNTNDFPASSQPLLETDTNRPERPISGPEIDDLDENPNGSLSPSYNPGIDDGLYDRPPSNNPNGKEKHPKPSTPSVANPGRPYYIPPEIPDVPEISPAGRPPPDMNIYQQKKNFAQGMMDIALLTANASQLRYVLETGQLHPFYIISIVLISGSLLLQVGVGIGLILMSRYNVKEYYDICSADRINNFCVIGVFLITIINVFIASFSVSATSKA